MTDVAVLRYAWAAPATLVGLLARVRGHEQAHARQYERWGLLYFPLDAGAAGAPGRAARAIAA